MTDNTHTPDTYTPDIPTSRLKRAGKLQLVALIGQFAPQSTIYSANDPMKSSTDDVIAKGADLSAKTKDASVKQQAYFAAITARGTSETTLDTALEVFKGNAKTFCKSEQDLKNLGVGRKPPKAKKGAVPLVAPDTVTGKPGKELGTIEAQAKRIAGLSKYIVAISVNPIGPTTFEVLPGTSSKRTITGLVSGQQYWIRYCTERGQARSDWSAPILVTAR